MGICYHCGKEIDEQQRCPLCNLTFCEEHMPPEQHNCIALSKDFKVKKGAAEKKQKTISDLEPLEGEEEPVPGVHSGGISYMPVDEGDVKEVRRRKEPSGGVTAPGSSFS